MTRALIVVESYFGNTRAVVKAVVTGLIEDGIEVQIIDATRAPSALLSDLDLLVLGTPTHNRRLPTTATRAKAREQAASEETFPGIGEWLETMAIPISIDAAASDTIISKDWLNGSTVKATARALQRRQGRRTVSVRNFMVTANKGPSANDQETDAHNWERELVTSTNTR